MVPGFLPRWDVEEVNSEALLIITTYYYTILQQLLLHCYYIHATELLAVLFLCCKTRRKMLVFVRPSFLPLFWFLSCSPLYTASPFHLIQCIILISGRKNRGYARYSPLLYFPLFVLPDRPLQSTLEPWSPGAGDPRCRLPQHEDPRCLLRHRVSLWPGVVWRFPGRRPRLFDLLLFVLAFLRQPCILVSVLRYFCFR